VQQAVAQLGPQEVYPLQRALAAGPVLLGPLALLVVPLAL
jgi:hypothetical protein